MTFYRLKLTIWEMYLGVDLGQKTTGLAIAEGQFASAYKTIKHESPNEAAKKVSQICDQLGADTVIIGVVEGKIRPMFENFTKALRTHHPSLKTILHDETLTTRQARDTMVKLQVPKKKRGQKEHEVAAAILLQSYLDSI